MFDIGIRDGKIAALVPGGVASAHPLKAQINIDAAGLSVTPGLIDSHAHVFQYVTGRFGLEADLCGVRSGLTTLLDQGGPSCMALPVFREYVVKPKKMRVLTYLSSYMVGGMEGHYYPSLYTPECVDVAATVKSALANTDIVKGFKAHAELGGFARWGIEVMKQAAQIGQQAQMPVYIHFGQLWPLSNTGANGVDPDTILAQVAPLLKAGDILAHPFSRHPGGFVNQAGQVHPIVRGAIDRGLKTDVGHGSHFSYRMAKIALDAGIEPDTLGADMHGYNTTVPIPAVTPDVHSDPEHMFFGKQRFLLTSAMTAMLALGMPLDRVVSMATNKVVEVFGLLSELGMLVVGNPADITVLHDDRGRFVLRDNEDIQLLGMLDFAFVRSPIAHGRILGVEKPVANTASAFTMGDLTGVLPIREVSSLLGFKSSVQWPLAREKVGQIGEPIAMCVAANRALAEDLVAQVLIDGDINEIAARAPIVVRRHLRTARQSMAPLEGRGVVCEWNTRLDQLVVCTSAQIPHINRAGLSECLGLDHGQIRVVSPGVGGDFGYKGILLPEEICLAWLAKHLGRPVRWLEDRREHFALLTSKIKVTHSEALPVIRF